MSSKCRLAREMSCWGTGWLGGLSEIEGKIELNVEGKLR